MSSATPDPRDRLNVLLPAVYRQRDSEQGSALQELLRVVSEQVNLVEADIDQLYANWFIETCQDWVVPYIADLVSYRPVRDLGEPGAVNTTEGVARNIALYPRQDVANTIRHRRRKGTFALLNELARDVAGWPARAVEFYSLVLLAQGINHLHLARGRTVDLRRGDALDRIEGAFDVLARTVSVGRISSSRTRTWYNIPSVGLFIWRLKPYSVTYAPAYALDRAGNRFTFSILGNDAPLMTSPVAEADPNQPPGELNVPAWIRRHAFETNTADYYGPQRSLSIWRGDAPDPIPLQSIVPADLTNWFYTPQRDQVAVDPVLGRIVFSPRNPPRRGVWVSYHYGFSTDMGGGEYGRVVSPTDGYVPGEAHPSSSSDPPPSTRLYRVGAHGHFATLGAAIALWSEQRPEQAVIEITDSGVYIEPIEIMLDTGQRLELRAANRTRPTIRLLDWYTNRADAVRVGRNAVNGETEGDDGEGASPAQAAPPARVIFDGLLITGRGIQVEGEIDEVIIRHCTLVPGWSLRDNCDPEHAADPSIELFDSTARLTIDHSIIGTVRVNDSEIATDPVQITVTDSILDSAQPEYEALSGPDERYAYAVLTVQRSTVFGPVLTRAIALAENSIFVHGVNVARRQIGCMRFCSVPPGSRTPRRYECQPDMVRAVAQAAKEKGEITLQERDDQQRNETLRVTPQFNSVRYGSPTYAQLSLDCATEITQGADDESSMGAFHDLFEPQRQANLRTRLAEFTPAGADADLVFVT